eukprot:Hpha_TRINITY_DN11920_c0_g1::TRINITY_DN11920_c0_g1_i1::g.20779::m.20779
MENQLFAMGFSPADVERVNQQGARTLEQALEFLLPGAGPQPPPPPPPPAFGGWGEGAAVPMEFSPPPSAPPGAPGGAPGAVALLPVGGPPGAPAGAHAEGTGVPPGAPPGVALPAEAAVVPYDEAQLSGLGFGTADIESVRGRCTTVEEAVEAILIQTAPPPPPPQPMPGGEVPPSIPLDEKVLMRAMQDGVPEAHARDLLVPALAAVAHLPPGAVENAAVDWVVHEAKRQRRGPAPDDAAVLRALAFRFRLEEELHRKIMALGAYRGEEAEQLVQDAVTEVMSMPQYTTHEEIESAALQRLLHQHNTTRREVVLEDPILGDDVPVSEMLVIECRRWHTVSYEALYHGLKAEDFLPTCPNANHPNASERCNHALLQEEVEEILNGYARVQEPGFCFPPADIEKLGLHRGTLVRGGEGWVSAHFARLFLRKASIDMGCIECPNGTCGTMVQVSGGRQRVTCPRCKFSFCSGCKRMHHFQVPCEDILTLTRAWDEWKHTHRQEFLRRMAAEDEGYAKALESFEKERRRHEEDKRAAAATWETLQADEAYKASHCRLCPACDRVVEKLDGCDSMVCGRNSAGGNAQDGCGRPFNWTQAKKYRADVGRQPHVRPPTEAEPVAAARHRHLLAPGVPLNCDVCREPIVGPLARCLHCPSHNVCIRCSDAGHDPHHVFRLIMGDE